jgi:hypothetical protein
MAVSGALFSVDKSLSVHRSLLNDRRHSLTKQDHEHAYVFFIYKMAKDACCYGFCHGSIWSKHTWFICSDLLQNGTKRIFKRFKEVTYFNKSVRSQFFIWGHHIERSILGRLLVATTSAVHHLLLELLDTVVPTSCSAIVVVCGASTAPEVLVSALVASLPSGHPIAIYSAV